MGETEHTQTCSKAHPHARTEARRAHANASAHTLIHIGHRTRHKRWSSADCAEGRLQRTPAHHD
eukprot:1166999-Alexandrium_andersonii.AAC.1